MIWAALLAGSLIVLYLVVAVLLSWHTYSQVEGPLQTAQATLTRLAHDPSNLDSPNGRTGVELDLIAAGQEVSTAQAQINGSIGLNMLGVLPGLHAQLVGLKQLVGDLDTTTQNSIALLRSVSTLTAHTHGLVVSIPDLRALSAEFSRAQQNLSVLDRTASGLWGPIGADRHKFDIEDQRAVHLLRQGGQLTTYAIPFLGANEPRTYLVVGENNAEMRDQGAPLSYSLMAANNGVLTVTNGGSIGPLQPKTPISSVRIPASTQAAFGGVLPTLFWQNTDSTPDFAVSGQVMQAMYDQATGAHVNGVIGLDVPALQSVLALTGPVTVPGVDHPITSGNAANILLHQLYQGLSPESSQAPRKEVLGQVTSAAIHVLQGGSADFVALARAMAKDVGGRHLLVWDEVPKYESVVHSVGASGALDTIDPSGAFHVAVENATATKLDYFVHVAISDSVLVQRNGSAVVNTSVELTNNAPSGQPASYQFGPDGVNSTIPGEYVGRVFLWGPVGSIQRGAVLESGLMLNHEVDLTLMPGQSATAQFSTIVPRAVRHGRLELTFVPQSRLTPDSVTVHLSDIYQGRFRHPSVEMNLVKTTSLTWTFSSPRG